MKDNFSDKSNLYQQFRPTYPTELLDWIYQQVAGFESAWDCGTGNGQIASELATKFKNVFATDISEQQLSNAPLLSNITYSKQPAEQTDFANDSFDLITVGQAIHWFEFEKFYAEVKRTAKPKAILAVMGYGKFTSDPAIDNIINRLYTEIVGAYWDKERKYIEENYITIPFPFTEIKCPVFSKQYFWALPQLIGYLETWSAVKHYQKEKDQNPVDLIKKELEKVWKTGEVKEVKFPIITRMGRIN
jgi:ubiquinone/menaquinone biosynthesis C-methylase UbiE